MPQKPTTFRPRAPKPHRQDKRPTAHQRGYGASWQRIRLAVLAEDPCCTECLKRGVVRPATEVDHILPLPHGTHQRDNLNPLCRVHHQHKTQQDKRRGLTRSQESR